MKYIDKFWMLLSVKWLHSFFPKMFQKFSTKSTNSSSPSFFEVLFRWVFISENRMKLDIIIIDAFSLWDSKLWTVNLQKTKKSKSLLFRWIKQQRLRVQSVHHLDNEWKITLLLTWQFVQSYLNISFRLLFKKLSYFATTHQIDSTSIRFFLTELLS